jgi:hypothetical protein
MSVFNISVFGIEWRIPDNPHPQVGASTIGVKQKDQKKVL